MKLTDIHTHRRPPESVWGIQNLMNPDQVKNSLDQPGSYSAGLHPWHIHPDYWREDVQLLRECLHHPNLFAIGEAGLDRLTDLPLSLQVDVFRAMVELSETAKKPLLIHAVRTHGEIMLLKREMKPVQAWIIHGFNLRKSIADGLLDSGFHLSFGAQLLHENSSASQVFTDVPDDRFFLESDDSSIDMKDLYVRAANLRGCTVEQLTESLYGRFNKLFSKV
ncbi:MAG: TatD family hydrolase [Bacteroidota bacterium]